MSLFQPDPEAMPGEAEEQAELTYRLQESIHDFEPGPDGRCIAEARKFCYTHKIVDWCEPCGADKWSVLHWDEEAEFRERHWHGGGDCMCFEGDY